MVQVETSSVSYKGPAHEIKAYVAKPQDAATLPGLLLIHEIWGLTPHIKDVAVRLAGEGFYVMAPDLMGSDPQLAPLFTPEVIDAVTKFMFTFPPGKARDPETVQQELAKLPEDKRKLVGGFYASVMGGKLPQDRLAEEVSLAYHLLRQQSGVNAAKIGSIGFCFGGTHSFRLACAGETQACVVFYGQNPEPIELVEKIACPVLGNYGGLDTNLNATLDKMVAAMVRYQKDFEMKLYPGAPHAFFNDSNAWSYRPAAAKQAWQLSVEFLNRALK